MNPDLDDRLNESAPRLEGVPSLDPALAELVQATRTAPRRRPVGRRGVLIGTTTAGIVLAGTAAAAALGLGPWTSDAGRNPDGSIAFTLPNGVACEYRIGHLASTGDTDKIRAWLDDHTLEEIADVDGTITVMRAESHTFTRDDGTSVDIGYGTAYYDANVEYVTAINRAVHTAIADRAEDFGILDGTGTFSSGQEIRCADGWEPGLDTDWLPQP